MIHCRLLTAAICLAALFSPGDGAFAGGGTRIVAKTGEPAHVYPSWPEGVDKLVNDASRTSGWNSWFSEWPNDVYQYAFEIKSTDDLNRLIEKLAAIKSDLRQIRLSHLKEPSGLGWVTHVPKGNQIPVIFSIGDQARIDDWFKRVRKPFGVMEFTATPEAVPPTLTIFVQNKVVKLDELKIPEGIDVLAGYVPTVFHKFNTTIEQKKAKESANTTDSKPQNNELDDSSLAAIKKVEAFLESQNSRATTSKAENAEGDHHPGTTVGEWSEPVNFLSARLLVTLEEHEVAESPSYFRYAVVLEVRNDHGADLAFVNQPSFENIEVRDASGKLVNVLSGGGNHRQGKARWAVILPYTYLGLKVDTPIPVDVGLFVGSVSPDKRSLTATLISKKQTGAEAYWFGEMEPPPAKEWVGEIQIPKVSLPVPQSTVQKAE